MKALPRYMQVMNYYIPLIKAGKLKEGAKMPTEEEICELFSISRITVRRALDGLQQNGYIYKQQGKGSFVMSKKTGFQLNHLKGFTEEMKMLGKDPSSEIIFFEIITPSDLAAQVLGIDQSQKIYLLERLRMADGIPIAIERVHLPFYRFPTLQSSNLKESLYDILQYQFGCESYKGIQEISAGLASEEEAKLLKIAIGSAVLHINRTTFEQDGVAYEYVESTYRGDQYQFTATLYK
ncbi:MAG: phosphonate metabolism transcriptional regulator PhnF [Firmicutes bacterium]|nr:phosphonate metabolism transcriptional regulator PhnF [Bacillota bacterium]